MLARPTGPARPAGHPLAYAVRVRFAQALEHPMVGLKPGSTLHSRLLRAAAELAAACPIQVQVGALTPCAP